MNNAQPSPAPAAPLAGIRVIEFGHIISGPFCTLMLAGLGADVIKIEAPGKGDDLRSIGRYEGREHAEDYFNANNYSKRSVTLDLKTPQGVETAKALAARADVLVENFSTGTAARLGIGWEAISAINPRIIYCSISGFGQTGAGRTRPAVDNIIQGISGIMSVTGEPEGPPMQVGAPVADVTASMCGAVAILGALHGVAKGRIGCHIDISMQAAMVYALSPRMGGVLHTGVSPARIGNQNPMRVPSDVYRTADGADIFLIVANDRGWAPFCRAIKREEWIEDQRFATNRDRTVNRDIVNAFVREEIGRWRSQELLARLEAEKVPVGPINDYAAAVADSQLIHRGMIREVEHPASGAGKIIGPPWLMNGATIPVNAPPTLGQHTREVLSDWLSDDPRYSETPAHTSGD